MASCLNTAAIRDLHKRYDAAWKARDPGKAAAFDADDATFADEQGMEPFQRFTAAPEGPPSPRMITLQQGKRTELDEIVEEVARIGAAAG